MTAEPAMTREDTEEAEADDDHLAGVEDGAGCTEIWEHLSRARRTGGETRDTEADDD
jgi:hypothetical protein